MQKRKENKFKSEPVRGATNFLHLHKFAFFNLQLHSTLRTELLKDANVTVKDLRSVCQCLRDAVPFLFLFFFFLILLDGGPVSRRPCDSAKASFKQRSTKCSIFFSDVKTSSLS